MRASSRVRRVQGRRLWVPMAVIAALLGVTTSATTGLASAAGGPCGSLTYDPTNLPIYDHVVVIMDENLSYPALQKSSVAPYLKSLALTCGSETNMHAATHPSQPNYMAATSGIATTLGTRTGNDNIFHQAQVAGRTWGVFEESMPFNCAANNATTAPTYKNGHNPAFWYNDLRTPVNTCKTYDVPRSPGLNTAIAADALPAYSWVAPNLCDDMHWATSCTYPQASRVAQGDSWLSTFIPTLTGMPSYAAGRTLIIITFDEGGEAGTVGAPCTDPTYYVSHPDCNVPTLVLSPYIIPGATDSSSQNLYSLLATTEQILGLPPLGQAVNQPSMRTGLGF
jgi:phosphatidylinositol-3-phosphatase